jgi:hypothetical protein
VHQVSDWCSGAAAYFGWMREAKRENTRFSASQLLARLKREIVVLWTADANRISKKSFDAGFGLF